MTGQEVDINIHTQAPFEVFDLKPAPADVTAEVLDGLAGRQKRLSPKFFYDETGSRLFEAITELPEYYLTRTELSIFDEHMPALARAVTPGACLVEYGSGSSLKVRKVLEEVRPSAYVPVDISGDHLVDMALKLADDFPGLAIYPTCADFTGELELPPPVEQMEKIGFFPGSSIGNFEPSDAEVFLSRVRRTLGEGSRLIIGVDLVKEPALLEAAYDDAAGVTAEFNLNVLRHLGDRLDVDFDTTRFSHRARFNQDISAIQMFLDVRESHDVTIGGKLVRFEAGESILTENSFKYAPESFLELAGRAGFAEEGLWMDSRGWFAVFLLGAQA